MLTIQLPSDAIIEITDSIILNEKQLGISEEEEKPVFELRIPEGSSGVLIKNLSDHIYLSKRIINPFTFSSVETTSKAFRVDGMGDTYSICTQLTSNGYTISSHNEEPLILWTELSPGNSVLAKLYDRICYNMKKETPPVFTVQEDSKSFWELMPWLMELED